jgi:ABC-type microcin C transport system duplicated ATPase subunit YejF
VSVDSQPLLDVRDLSIAFHQGGRTTLAVDRVSFSLQRGRTLALVVGAVSLALLAVGLAALLSGR